MTKPAERSTSPNSKTGPIEWIERSTVASNIEELRLALRLCPDHPTIKALLAEKLFLQSIDSVEANWFLESAKLFFEKPITELPAHVSKDHYDLGKATLERIDM